MSHDWYSLSHCPSKQSMHALRPRLGIATISKSLEEQVIGERAIVVRKLKQGRTKSSKSTSMTWTLKAMSHGAIFLATCNAILLLRDVNLANTRLCYILLMYSSHIKHSSLVNIS